MKYNKKMKKDYSSKYMGYADRQRTAPASTLKNQPDQQDDANAQVAKVVGGTNTNRLKGRRRMTKPTFMDKIKRKFKMKKRKKRY